MAAVSATAESAAEDERSLDNDKVDGGGSDRDNDDDDSVVDDDDEDQGHQQKKRRAVDAEMSEEDEKKEEPEEDEMEQEEDEEAEEDDADEDANEIVPDPVLSDLTAVTTKKSPNRKRSRSSMDDDDDDQLLPPIPSLRVTQRDRSLRSVPAILDQSKCVLLLEVLRLLDLHKTHRKDPLNRRKSNWTALQRSFHEQPMGSRYRPSGNAGKFKKRIFKAFQYWKEWAQERGFDFVGLAPDPKDDADRARAKEFVRLLYKIDAESKGEPVPDDIASGDEGGDDGGGGKRGGGGRASAAGGGGSPAAVSRSGGDATAAAAAGGVGRRSPRRRSQHHLQQQQNPPASVSDFSSAVSDLIRADEYAAASGATPEARRTALVGYYVAEAVAHQRAHTHLLREELRSHRAARDEEDIRRLEELQAKIDSYGVGGAGAGAGGGGLGSGRGVPLHVYVELRDRCLARLSRSGREGADEADDHHRGGGGGDQITEAHV